jgi:hypothetical protein
MPDGVCNPVQIPPSVGTKSCVLERSETSSRRELGLQTPKCTDFSISKSIICRFIIMALTLRCRFGLQRENHSTRRKYFFSLPRSAFLAPTLSVSRSHAQRGSVCQHRSAVRDAPRPSRHSHASVNTIKPVPSLSRR